MQRIDVRATARAGPAEVWTALTDCRSWPAWAPFDEVTVEQGHEVGEVRRVRSGRVTTRERVVGFEPPHRYVYEIVSGLPIRDYVAEILLSSPEGDETEIHWQATFRARIPGTGWVLERLMRRVIAQAADSLAAHVSRPA